MDDGGKARVGMVQYRQTVVMVVVVVVVVEV